MQKKKVEEAVRVRPPTYTITETYKDNEYIYDISYYLNLKKDMEVKLEKAMINGKPTIVSKVYLKNSPQIEIKNKLTNKEKRMIMYILAKKRFEGFWVWVDKLEKGNEKDKKKATAYKQKNLRNFNERNLENAINAILEESEKGHDYRVLAAQGLQESILSLLPYGQLDEVGLYHARKCVAKEQAKKLGLEGNIEEILLNPRHACSLRNYHMLLLLKSSKTPEEALQKYNAGKYWKNYSCYSEAIKEIIKEIVCLELLAKERPREFASYYSKFKTTYELSNK